MSAVEIVDDLQRWPEQAIVEGGPEYVIAISKFHSVLDSVTLLHE